MAMGAQIQGVVVAWQMYALTHDPLALGMVGLAEAAPFIGFALLRGARRRRERPTGGRAHGARVLFACALALAGGQPVLSTRGPAARPWIRGASTASSSSAVAARSFLLPSRNALGAELVPRALFPGRVAWRTGIWQVAAVTGPALGGSSTSR